MLSIAPLEAAYQTYSPAPPMVAAAEPYSVARLCLEEVLPGAVDDARRAVRLLRAAAAGAASPVGAADLD
jgi:hypothetical protein